MEIDKQQFRDLVEEGKIGPALNQLADISHFLGDAEVREQLETISDQHFEYEEAPEGSAEAEKLYESVRTSLLALIDRLPEEFTPAEAGEGGGGGCAAAVIVGLILLVTQPSGWLPLIIELLNH